MISGHIDQLLADIDKEQASNHSSDSYQAIQKQPKTDTFGILPQPLHDVLQHKLIVSPLRSIPMIPISPESLLHLFLLSYGRFDNSSLKNL